MPLRSGSLVCDACWSTLFTFDAFQVALSAKDSDRSNEPNRSKGFSYTTQPWEQIEEGEEKGCNWCDFLWDEIRFWYNHRKKKESPEPEEKFNVTVKFEKHEALQRVILTLVVENDWSPRYSVCCHPEDNAASFIPSRNLVWQVSSPRAYELASQCLTNCTLHHTCPKPSHQHLPTRVIDCENPENPKLLISAGLEGVYIALSYVWGEPQPHSTTTHNIATYLTGIPSRILPPTIRDAINCTKRLGLRYLWIDSLCIMQDSIEDKDREIPQMCDIYRKAYVTIIAAAAKRVGQGFLQDRSEPIDSALPFWCPDGRLGTISVEEEGRAPEGGVEPVDGRAWCYQERLLSPRALIYTTDTLRYRCQALQSNIGDEAFYFPPGGNDGLKLPPMMLSAPTDTSLANKDLKTLRSAWWGIVAEYTKRRLTVPSDKLLAISGIAQLFHRYWKTRYIAGLWERTLSGDLLWQHKRAKRSAAELLASGDYRAPSWSWAATDGEIVAGSKLSDENVLWKILKCEVFSATKDGGAFGRIVGGVLEVNAILRPVVWDPTEMELYEVHQSIQVKTPAGLRRKGHIGYVYLDDENNSINSNPETPGRVRGFAVAVGTDSSERPIRRLTGLLVVPDKEKDGTFCRVGMFYVNGQYNDDESADEDTPSCRVDSWINHPRKNVCIV